MGSSFDDSLRAHLDRVRRGSAYCTGPADDDEVLSYYVPEPMRDVVRAALDTGTWHVAVNALLEDERAVIVSSPGPSATEITIDQTRMIAHEVRNALGPVRYNVDELLSEELADPHREHVEAAKRGVVGHERACFGHSWTLSATHSNRPSRHLPSASPPVS